MNFGYKRCVVPDCGHTTISEPGKLYFRVPDKTKLRNEWLTLAGRDPSKLSSKSTMYFCEDHFDPPNDMENYIQYKVMGAVKRVMLKPNRLPTKFECQAYREPAASTDSTNLETAALQSNVTVLETMCISSLDLVMDSEDEEATTLNHQDPEITEQCRFCGEFTQVSATSEKPYLVNNRTAFALNSVSVDLDFSDDTLPKAVCRECDRKLQGFYDFVNKVKAAQTKLINVEETREDIETVFVVTETTPEQLIDIKEEVDIVSEVGVKPIVSHKRKSDCPIEMGAKKNRVTTIKRMEEYDERNGLYTDIKDDVIYNDVDSETQMELELGESGTVGKFSELASVNSVLYSALTKYQDI